MPPSVKRGRGHNNLTVEDDLANAIRNAGYCEDIMIPVHAWKTGAGLTMPARADGAVGIESVDLGTSQGVDTLTWDDTADNSDLAIYQFTLPGQFNPKVDKIKLYTRVRKFDTTGSASENADLTLNGTLRHFDPSAATAVDETAIAKLLPAKIATVTDASWTLLLYEWSGEGLKPFSTCKIILNPNEAVGTALYIQMLASLLKLNRNTSYNNKALMFI